MKVLIFSHSGMITEVAAMMARRWPMVSVTEVHVSSTDRRTEAQILDEMSEANPDIIITGNAFATAGLVGPDGPMLRLPPRAGEPRPTPKTVNPAIYVQKVLKNTGGDQVHVIVLTSSWRRPSTRRGWQRQEVVPPPGDRHPTSGVIRTGVCRLEALEALLVPLLSSEPSP